MSIEAMKQALEALERGRPQITGVLVQQDQDAAITALHLAIKQAENPPRKWVGLTDEEIVQTEYSLWQEMRHKLSLWQFARDIEAKLREKNAAPPQRQPLTEEEIDALHSQLKVQLLGTFSIKDIYRAVEAALREKNA